MLLALPGPSNSSPHSKPRSQCRYRNPPHKRSSSTELQDIPASNLLHPVGVVAVGELAGTALVAIDNLSAQARPHHHTNLRKRPDGAVCGRDDVPVVVGSILAEVGSLGVGSLAEAGNLAADRRLGVGIAWVAGCSSLGSTF